MLLAGAREWDVDLRASFVIGDRWRDIEAGNAVGAFSILLGRPYSACTTYDAIVTNLSAAVDLVLQRIGTE
jgi:D-glycero-D-manno-heptose 1,7-bisphosphate phosphatase